MTTLVLKRLQILTVIGIVIALNSFNVMAEEAKTTETKATKTVAVKLTKALAIDESESAEPGIIRISNLTPVSCTCKPCQCDSCTCGKSTGKGCCDVPGKSPGCCDVPGKGCCSSQPACKKSACKTKRVKRDKRCRFDREKSACGCGLEGKGCCNTDSCTSSCGQNGCCSKSNKRSRRRDFNQPEICYEGNCGRPHCSHRKRGICGGCRRGLRRGPLSRRLGRCRGGRQNCRGCRGCRGGFLIGCQHRLANKLDRIGDMFSHKMGYFIPTGGDGRGLPPFGHYNRVYPVGSHSSHPSDQGAVYSAEGYGVPISVPLAPNVRHQYNYSWGTPTSRLTPVSNPAGYGY